MPFRESYPTLESKFPKYNDLKSVIVHESHEKMVPLSLSNLKFSTKINGIKPSSNEEIFVRSSVIQKLIQAQNYLNECTPEIFIEIFYGWRSPTIQKESFEKMKEELSASAQITIDDVHKFIAAPDVAGHPTGGAIDVRLIDKNGIPLDMGTEPHEFVLMSYVFSPEISDIASKNRQILRSAMMSAGFAPFNGEWWHFSYGDREWAYFWNKPYAIYDQIKCEDFK